MALTATSAPAPVFTQELGNVDMLKRLTGLVINSSEREAHANASKQD